MLPIGDDNSRRRSAPVVTVVLIALNLLVFFLELSGGDAFVEQWAFVPRRFLANPGGESVTLFTSMFMHAGWVATCSTCGSLAIMWKTALGRSSSHSSTCSAELRQCSPRWRLTPDQACRVWEHQERLLACSEPTSCCSRREESKCCKANK